MHFRLGPKSGAKGSWVKGTDLKPWSIRFGAMEFGLEPTPFGHVGIFPEQSGNWQWILDSPNDLSGLRALNLFAYTGGTTMALASRGVEVAHIDSSKKVVKWARENAARSGLSEAPIRWIVEDAMTFVQREIKRGKIYDIVVADPPSFGHGLKRQSWKYDRDIASLLDGIAELTKKRPRLLLITGHTIGYDQHQTIDQLRSSFGNRLGDDSQTGPMTLTSNDSRPLRSGYFVRFAQ